jgi:hypothetical protein
MRLIEKAFHAILYHTQAPKSPQNSDFLGVSVRKSRLETFVDDQTWHRVALPNKLESSKQPPEADLFAAA